jgi:hypothetical protein
MMLTNERGNMQELDLEKPDKRGNLQEMGLAEQLEKDIIELY